MLTPWTYPFAALNCGTPAINRRCLLIPKINQLNYKISYPRITFAGFCSYANSRGSFPERYFSMHHSIYLLSPKSQNTRKPTDKTWVVPSFFNPQTSFFQIESGGFPENIPGFRFYLFMAWATNDSQEFVGCLDLQRFSIWDNGGENTRLWRLTKSSSTDNIAYESRCNSAKTGSEAQ